MTCVDAAVAAIEGEALPEVYESPTTVVSRGEFEEYFVKNGDTWNINFDKLNNCRTGSEQGNVPNSFK